ncbi:type VI secretion system baseplate subunit TssF, partial [Pseudomonas syringae]
DEGLVDYSERSFLGYRLLHEYFTFPDKFMFF